MAEEQLRYRVVRSDRKTLALQIKDGMPLVRAPRGASDARIAHFVQDNRAWIMRHVEEYRRKQAAAKTLPALGAQELRVLAEQAARVIPARVRYYAERLGVTYGRITIRNQKTRWGSCSRTGNLNFNCLLMLAPPEVLDSVVVHELCHRKYMNHSEAFYREVLTVFPAYREWHGWLKQNGATLLLRMQAGKGTSPAK